MALNTSDCAPSRHPRPKSRNALDVGRLGHDTEQQREERWLSAAASGVGPGSSTSTEAVSACERCLCEGPAEDVSSTTCCASLVNLRVGCCMV